MRRFEDVIYDDLSNSTLRVSKDAVLSLSAVMRMNLAESRERSMAMTKLEETLMWIKKAIEHDQLVREGKIQERSRS